MRHPHFISVGICKSCAKKFNRVYVGDEVCSKCSLSFDPNATFEEQKDLLKENKMKTFKITISNMDSGSGAKVFYSQATDKEIIEQYYEHYPNNCKVYVEELEISCFNKGGLDKMEDLIGELQECRDYIMEWTNKIRSIKDEIKKLDPDYPMHNL